MTKFYLALFLLLFSMLFLPESFAQRGSKNVQKDTLIYIFCSSAPNGLNAFATYQAAQQNLIKEESDRFVLKTGDDLLEKDFTLAKVQAKVAEMSRLGRNTRVIFHFFDHGQNTGGILPALTSSAPMANGQLIDVEKNVIEPLRKSKLGFLLVLVDACNRILPQQTVVSAQPGNTENNNRSLSMEAMLKKLEASRKEGKETIQKTAVERSLKKEHLGLLLSSKGWLAISTASPDQEAVAPRGIGGTGSLLFFDLLVNNHEVNKSWVKFLDEYRRTLEAADRNRIQTPIWQGKINDQPMSEEEMLNPLRRLKDDEIKAIMEQQNIKVSIEDLKNTAKETALEFCGLVDGLNEYSSLPPALRDICIKPINKVIMYDELSVPLNRDLNTNHVTLDQYRSKVGVFESTYIPDSLRLDRVYEDTRRTGVLYVVYFAGKNIDKARNLDTIVRQRIFLEIQPETDPNLWEKAKRRFRRLIGKKDTETSDAPLLVNQVRNVPGKWGAPPIPKPKPEPVVDITPVIIPPPSPEDFYQKNAKNLIRSLYTLIEEAANHNNQSPSKDTLLEKAKRLFIHPETDIFQYSPGPGQQIKTLTSSSYFERFWKDFEGFEYDSVYFSFDNPQTIPIVDKLSSYLLKTGEGQWQTKLQYEQKFKGFRKGKRRRGDITVKEALIWIIETPGKEPFYELRIGPVTVISTKPLPKTE